MFSTIATIKNFLGITETHSSLPRRLYTLHVHDDKESTNYSLNFRRLLHTIARNKLEFIVQLSTLVVRTIDSIYFRNGSHAGRDARSYGIAVLKRVYVTSPGALI